MPPSGALIRDQGFLSSGKQTFIALLLWGSTVLGRVQEKVDNGPRPLTGPWVAGPEREEREPGHPPRRPQEKQRLRPLLEGRWRVEKPHCYGAPFLPFSSLVPSYSYLFLIAFLSFLDFVVTSSMFS